MNIINEALRIVFEAEARHMAEESRRVAGELWADYYRSRATGLDLEVRKAILKKILTMAQVDGCFQKRDKGWFP